MAHSRKTGGLLIANQTNFDREWAAEFLVTLFRKDMHVLIIPLARNEGWASDVREWDESFQEGSDYHYDLERPFRSYGIRSFSWLDQYRCTREEAVRAIEQSDICVLSGNDPSACMDQIEELGIVNELKEYRGILVTLSEASHLAETEFESGWEGEKEMRAGLGLLGPLHLHMHYQETEAELRKMIRYLERDGQPLAVLSKNSGVFLGGGAFELLGDAFIAEESDLDELYSLL